jgi:hypothetical protein
VGPVDPNNPFVSQVHDFNPGILPNGVLWTIPLPADNVQANLATGYGSLFAKGLKIGDGVTIPESLSRNEGGPLKPATVSFNVTWSDPTATKQITDPKLGFAGTFLETMSAIWFSAETDDFAFVTDPPETSKGLFGWLGYEVNGEFFPTTGTPTAATPTG